MRYLAFTVFGKPRARHLPGLRVVVARDDADAHADPGAVGGDGDLFARRLWILHRRGADRTSGCDAVVRRSRHEDTREELRCEWGSERQVLEIVVAAGERHSLSL